MREPCFDQFLKVLRRERPDRPVLFEFIVAPRVMLAPEELLPEERAPENVVRNWIHAFARNGYDFVSLPPWLVGFPATATISFPCHRGSSVSRGSRVESGSGRRASRKTRAE
jgi:hypothetical protein